MSTADQTSVYKTIPGTPRANIPLIGLGLTGVVQPNADKEIEKSVEAAIEIGYRHFDTAYSYLNEVPIGNALKRAMDGGRVTREELCVITKLPGIGMHPDRVELFLRKSLENLQMNYVDVYLIHWPIGFNFHGDTSNIFPKKEDSSGTLDIDHRTDLEGIWRSMEKVCQAGLTKHIGFSNFNAKQIERIVNIATVLPANLQVELNVYLQQPKLVEFCNEKGIRVTAYAPLGSPGRQELNKKRGLSVTTDNLLENPGILEIAQSMNKAPAQILLRYLVQQGIAVIPKTTNVERLESNFNIFNFELSSDFMTRLRGLNKGESGRSFDFSSIPEGRLHPEFPF